MKRLLDRLFTLEEINGGKRCPTYLYRWTLFQPRWPRSLWRGLGIYLHHFVGDDWSRDLHDHPKRFISIGLSGSYIEETPASSSGQWEVHADEDGEMVRVRWSVPNDAGAYAYVRHYPGDSWGHNACEVEARRFNAGGRLPSCVPGFVPRDCVAERVYSAPWVRTFPAHHIHRLRVDGGSCWTLVIVLRSVREWGFWHGGQWIHWKDYVRGSASHIADKMRACL